MLEFDPFSPRLHRCPQCGSRFDDESHYRWWIYGYQLWLAERAIHAATLFALRGDTRLRDFARSVLEGYVDRYLEYPNADNVLGPTRPFFSTYLESIWLLQLAVALDLLEMATPPEWHRTLGAQVRDRVVEPSARLIAGYDEGLSNRQVWNNAALLASARLLERPLATSGLSGGSGLVGHLTRGLLDDGTWYEGENYHLFAHRGLSYGVMIAHTAGETLDAQLIGRFDEAFATPFVTALPDFTFPSRRDSQYRVSLRQWRFAELAELGLARQPADSRLTGALATLYDGTVPRRETGRARSTAEAERNSPATALDRGDLGWRSLLFAPPSLPPLAPSPPASVVLPGQGLAILRREQGSVYVALDYGHSGAGHGHPDRLNLVLVRGNDRWLDDVGTGSYVDPSLHWYRSTLAHNAPLVNGRSQERVHGTLAAFDETPHAGWVRAFVDGVAPGVRLERTVVAMPRYVIDELTWQSDHDVDIDLPFHVDGELAGAGPWVEAKPTGGGDVEDGFGFLEGTETAAAAGDVRLDARLGVASAAAHVLVDAPHDWWRATSFGAPGAGRARFHFVRARGRSGRIATVWDLVSAVSRVTWSDRSVRVMLGDGSSDDHCSDTRGWHITRVAADGTSAIDLAGVVAAPRAHASTKHTATSPRRPHLVPVRSSSRPLTFELGERDYRRSELTWAEAGKPSAVVSLSVDGDALVVEIDVKKHDVHFAPECGWNPLDNEPADTNSDGVQLHLKVAGGNDATERSELALLMVPEAGGSEVRVTTRSSGHAEPRVSARWRRASGGYAVQCAVALEKAGIRRGRPFLLGLVVNDMAAERERRRGQLVLGGASGDFVYLRGDRLDTDHHLPFLIADA